MSQWRARMLLTPYRVLDLAGSLGSFTGRILADLGADVVKVEPPGGDPARRAPQTTGEEGAARRFDWLAANANKRSITIDLGTETGREDLRALVPESDIVIESFMPGELDAMGLGFSALRALNPRIILVSVTPFGQSGPYRHYLASDIEIMAMSGAMSLAGAEDGEPMRVTAPQANMWVSTEAAIGALTALVHRTTAGRGQHVDVSAQAAVLSALAHAPVFWDLTHANPSRAGIFVTGRSMKGAKMRVFWPCTDGWINFILYGGSAGRHTNEQLVGWMAEKGVAPDWMREIDWRHFDVTQLDQQDVDRLEAPIADFFQTVTKAEFLDGAVEREMLGYPVSTVADIAADRQLDARGFWQHVIDDTTGRTRRFPGGFAIVDGRRLSIRRGPPSAGQHNGEVGLPALAPRLRSPLDFARGDPELVEGSGRP